MPALKSTGLKHVHRHLRGFKRQDSRRAINSLKLSESFIVKKTTTVQKEKMADGKYQEVHRCRSQTWAAPAVQHLPGPGQIIHVQTPLNQF